MTQQQIDNLKINDEYIEKGLFMSGNDHRCKVIGFTDNCVVFHCYQCGCDNNVYKIRLIDDRYTLINNTEEIIL